MQVLDRHGKLFGIVNIVDAAIVCAALVAIPVFVSAFRAMTVSPLPVQMQWVRVKAVAFVMDEVVDLIKPGDTGHDAFGAVNARVVSVARRANAAAVTGTRDTGMLIPITLELDIHCTAYPAYRRLLFEGMPLIVGLTERYVLKTDRYTVVWYVVGIGEERSARI